MSFGAIDPARPSEQGSAVSHNAPPPFLSPITDQTKVMIERTAERRSGDRNVFKRLFHVNFDLLIRDHVPSANMAGVGVVSCTAARHQGDIQMSAILIYCHCTVLVMLTFASALKAKINRNCDIRRQLNRLD